MTCVVLKLLDGSSSVRDQVQCHIRKKMLIAILDYWCCIRDPTMSVVVSLLHHDIPNV